MILKPFTFKKTVTSAGTRERITTADTQVTSVLIQALSGNGGTIYVGGITVSSTSGVELSAGDSISMRSADLDLANTKIKLTEIYIDTDNSTDGVNVIYLEKG